MVALQDQTSPAPLINRTLPLRVTGLESWRYYQGSETQSTRKYVRQLLRMEPPNAMMLAGLAFESRLMDTEDRDYVAYRFTCADESDFDPASIIERPDVVQIPVEKTYAGLPCGINVRLRGRIDCTVGLKAVDWKTTYKGIQYEKYKDSYQWRCYLDMIGFKSFQYDVFQLRLVSDGGGAMITEMHYEIMDRKQFRFSAYPGMDSDICYRLDDWCQGLVSLARLGLVCLTDDGVRPVEGFDYEAWFAEEKED